MEVEEPLATTEASKQINAISKESVHRICSGQVVVDLAIAVKELVENSLDSGATTVDVKLVNHGKTCITVSDNGSGVLEKDFEGLGLKHYTSKLKEFSDLMEMETFGFRGEALSSLCALSDLNILTKHSTSKTAFELKFDKNGILVDKKPCARPQGTTVNVRNIFKNLPVRSKEFEKNIKNEFVKVIQIMYSYCLVSTGKRLSCVNIIGNRTNSIVSTSGVTNVLDNIISIFGKKAQEGLIEIQAKLPDKETLAEYNLPEGISLNFTWNCFVSSCSQSQGRSSPDRQFFFVNGRPCDLQKISRLVNHIYHKFNNKQYPFVYLNILLQRSSADINVTPDKRTILFTQEKLLMATIKYNLEKAWDDTQGKFLPNATLEDMNFVLKKRGRESPENEIPQKRQSVSEKKEESEYKNHFSSIKQNIALKLNKVNKGRISNFLNGQNNSEQKSDQVKTILDRFALKPKNNNFSSTELKDDIVLNEDDIILNKDDIALNEDDISLNKGDIALDKDDIVLNNDDSVKEEVISDKGFNDLEVLIEDEEKKEERKVVELVCQEIPELKLDDNMDVKALIDHDDPMEYFMETKPQIVELNINLEMVKQKMKMRAAQHLNKIKQVKVKFTKTLESKNEEVEDELKRELSKDTFKQIEIIGQFNLGFILAKTEGDLFIIDQHATDEKFRFEKLSKETKLKSQKLIVPKRLDLSSLNETILVENRNVFSQNGFDFEVKEEEAAGNRVRLTSIPVSWGWQFGQEDIEELIFLIREGSITGAGENEIPRPSRVRQMLASRACRSAVMIGTALNMPEMRKLLNQMSEMKNPWNCPHGRPTIRHLLCLSLL